MPSTFYGLEIGRRALTANQLALEVAGQNTANVNTPGYSRQVAVFDETDPYITTAPDNYSPAQLGTGVTIASINRVRDAYVDKRTYTANADQGALNNLRDVLGQVENAYGEPTITGIGSQLTNLFNSFSDLSASPESGAVRTTVRNNAQSLVSVFHQVSSALAQIAPEAQSRITSSVNDVNTISGQIAQLNQQILVATSTGEHPNDLLDKRGALLDQLSNLVDVQVADSKDPQTGQPNGEIQINVGGFTIVNGKNATALPSSTPVLNGNSVGLQGANGEIIPLQGGAIYGLARATGLVSGYQSDLNTLASNLITSVNAQHSAGYGLDGLNGRAFFSGTNAGTIEISTEVQNSVDAIAAAAPPTPPNTPAPGNGDNARVLSALNSQAVIGTLSLNQYYNVNVSSIGADSQTFQQQADNQTKIVTQLKNQQASVSGVNLDEELTKLLQYQRAYQAAARIINVQDDVLNRIINGLGAGTAVA